MILEFGAPSNGKMRLLYLLKCHLDFKILGWSDTFVNIPVTCGELCYWRLEACDELLYLLEYHIDIKIIGGSDTFVSIPVTWVITTGVVKNQRKISKTQTPFNIGDAKNKPSCMRAYAGLRLFPEKLDFTSRNGTLAGESL